MPSPQPSPTGEGANTKNGNPWVTAGEIVLNMMNQDGVRNGYDLKQLAKVRAVCHVPLIASGGAGTMEHFLEAFRDADVDGALAASVFHKQIINIGELKAYLAAQGVEIRVC